MFLKYSCMNMILRLRPFIACFVPFSDTDDYDPSSYAIGPTRYRIVLWSLTITFSTYIKLRFSSWFHVEIPC